MRYQAVIFDLDGVLVFTDAYHYLAWKTIADKLQIAFDENINHRLRGVSRMESLEIILSYSDKVLSAHDKRMLAAEKNTHYQHLLEKLSPEAVSQETRNMLDALREKGIRLAIGSSSKNASFILEKTDMASYFEVVVSGMDITHSKPDPEVFLVAAQQLGLSPSACLVIEDAHAGVQAAVDGHFDCAGIGDAASSELVTYRMEHLLELTALVF